MFARICHTCLVKRKSSHNWRGTICLCAAYALDTLQDFFEKIKYFETQYFQKNLLIKLNVLVKYLILKGFFWKIRNDLENQNFDIFEDVVDDFGENVILCTECQQISKAVYG